MSNTSVTQVVNIRELLGFEPKELLEGLRTDLNVKFEDNVVVGMSYKELIIMRYLMEMFKVYPTLQITSKYNLSNFFHNNMYTGDVLHNWMEVLNKDIIEYIVKPNQDRSLLERGHVKMWEITNDIYNEVLDLILPFASSLSIEDLLEIQMDDRLLDAIKTLSVKQDGESVTNCYNVLEDIIYNKEEIKDNFIVKGYKANSINRNQAKQLVGPRGFVTEINNKIYKTPIASSFTLGLNNILEMAMESRSGAKALNMSHKAIQESEYFARELQIACMPIEKVVDGDCGSKKYMDWYMFPGDNTRKPDINNMEGIRFINPETGKEDILFKHHGPLVNGKKIKIRTALSCKLENSRHICSACMGELAYAMPLNNNVGHYCVTSATEKITQGILSTKHLITSAIAADIVLDDTSNMFFTIKNGSTYYFKNIFDGKSKYNIIIDQESGFAIKDLAPHANVHKFDPNRVAMLNVIILEKINSKGQSELYPIQIKQGNRYGTLSHDFMEYISNNRYIMDDLDRYVISMDKWNYKKPLINMPEIEYDFLTLITLFRKELKFMDTDEIGVCKMTVERLLQTTFNIINYKLDFNLALLAVIIYAFTIKDPYNGDYSLARNVDEPLVGDLSTIISNRSLGGLYPWEEVVSNILSATSFNTNRFDHPLDVFFTPQQVINKLNKQTK